MGACISTPAKFAGISRRGFRVMRQDRNNSPNSSWDAADKSSRRSSSIYHQPRRVLKDSSPGNIRDRYELGKELGRGEFGITHECVEMETGERYACKMISKAKLRTEIDVEDVRREVEIMQHLPKHPNIVAFKEAFEDKEGIYLVMELCHGGELFDRIVARGHYTERAAAGIARTILEIVKVCHDHGVIHRDLKPENFLFADRSETAPLKAIDFGLSIFFQEGQRFSDIVGSPYYMAPEVLRRNYGKEVDVWSTGVILYILLCGVPPFWAETEEGIAHAIIRGKADFERDPWAKVSEEAKELIKAMLDMNPKTRISVTEVLEHPWIRDSENAPNINLGDNVRARINQFSLMNKFKKKVLRVVADNLPDDQMDSIIQLFHMMDTDKNGGLSLEELKDGLISLGQPVSDPDVKMLMEAADMDGNGTLSCDEFVTMSVHLRRIGNDEHLAQAFNCLDKNGDGYIDQQELGEALLEDNNALPCNDQLIKDIMLDIDLDKDGRISYQEFRAMMQTGADWKMASRQYSRALLNALSIKILRQSGQLK